MKDQLVTLFTPEGEALTGQPWNLYPRPQMKRDSFLCLNGDWKFSVFHRDARKNADNNEYEIIRVPFPPESVLSGIGRRFERNARLHYEKEFRLPEGFHGGRVLLHFGAVDQTMTMELNGQAIHSHAGGYNSFCFDVTDAIREENTLTVSCSDPSEKGIFPYGKQRKKRGGMWYTPISGIWQTVWLERVPSHYIRGLKIDVGTDFAQITAEGITEGTVRVNTPDGEISAKLQKGTARIHLTTPRHWSPEDPYLYEFSVCSEEDEVFSYFALRTLEIKTIDGLPRLCLNGKPYFFHGLLDQGYYSDGIYTPASPESYTRDILEMKSLGFNMLRKHIKVEPEHFYYECDRLGMIVFQDMVNNGKYSFLRDTALPTVGMKRFPDLRIHRNQRSRRAFEDSMKATVRQLYNHPCICAWTIFNEGWGQFEADRMYEEFKSMDSSRFIDATSGWFQQKKSDVESIHVYFKPVKIKPSDRPIFLSEFGGYSYRPEGHLFHPKKAYGYRFFKDRREFENALIGLYEKEIIPAVNRGLCGTVYTQLSDVEDETNGLLTYDRKVLKVSPERMRELAKKLKL